MQQEMENRDEETLELKETYTSLQQEVDIKTKKLKKVSAPTYCCFLHASPVLATVITNINVLFL